MLEIAVYGDAGKESGTVSKMVSEICSEIKRECHISVYPSSKELSGEGRKIDIAILDIMIPDLNGIELGKRLREKFPEIRLIYAAGEGDYCRQVINKVHAFSFLLKPIDKRELKEQLLECMRNIPISRGGAELIFRNVRNSRQEKLDSLRLRTGDILYCEYIKSKREIGIVLKNEIYYYREVFEKLSGKLKNYGFEVNCRGSIVNLRHIRRLKGYTIYLDNGQELPLAQKRVAEFKEAMNAYAHKN